MAPLRLDVPALSRGGLDRSEDVRSPEAVRAAWPTARVITVAPGGRVPVVTDGRGTAVMTGPATALGDGPPPGATLLGGIDGIHYWAIAGEPGPGAAAAAGRPETWETIRTVGPLLSDDDAAIATTAVALLGWHARARYCSRCGMPMTSDLTGHSRCCPGGHQEFPRTDPAVIVLIHDGDGNAVLARQPSWAPGRYSVLAGFTEAGESLEGTVVREVHEEIGVAVTDVAYLGSQPWPFPRSLMVAFSARAPRGAPLRPRPGEIEHAAWFPASDLKELLAGGSASSGAGVTLPASISIARRMVEAFVRWAG